MLAGRLSLSVVWQTRLIEQDAAMRTAACVAISLRCHCMAGVLHRSMTTAAPVPQVGQMAPNMNADLVR